eukprot:12549262-Alexandrium_andersonii.AAC.1
MESSGNSMDKAGTVQTIIDQVSGDIVHVQKYLGKFDHWCFQSRASLNFVEIKKACREVLPIYRKLQGLNEEMAALYKMKTKQASKANK